MTARSIELTTATISDISSRTTLLNQLAREFGQERTPIVVCNAFRGNTDKFLNLTVKKIPKQIFDRCEWGHNDYSLKVENFPKALVKPGQLELNL